MTSVGIDVIEMSVRTSGSRDATRVVLTSTVDGVEVAAGTSGSKEPTVSDRMVAHAAVIGATAIRHHQTLRKGCDLRPLTRGTVPPCAGRTASPSDESSLTRPSDRGSIPRGPKRAAARFLDDAQAARFAATAAVTVPFERLVIELLSRTGMRVGELCTLAGDAVVVLNGTPWLRVS
jgi:hypothetical protein